MSLSNYRKVIFSLGQEISMENLHSLKYLLQDLLTTKEIEDFDTPTDLFVFLEQRNELGSENFHLLKDLLAQINRQDLVRKLEDFEKKKLAERDRVVNAETSSIGFRFVKKEHMLDSVTDGEPSSSLPESDSEFEAAGRSRFLAIFLLTRFVELFINSIINVAFGIVFRITRPA